MRSTQQFSITLSHDMARLVRRKVKSGAYATESEVMRDGLRILQARDRAVERWLRKAVVPSYDAVVENPARAISSAAVRARLKGARRRPAKAAK